MTKVTEKELELLRSIKDAACLYVEHDDELNYERYEILADQVFAYRAQIEPKRKQRASQPAHWINGEGK